MRFKRIFSFFLVLVLLFGMAPQVFATEGFPEGTSATEPYDSEQDAPELDASEPDASEPDASEPDASKPDVSEPDVSEPDASEPDVSEPDVSEPPEDADEGNVQDETDGLILQQSYATVDAPGEYSVSTFSAAGATGTMWNCDSMVFYCSNGTNLPWHCLDMDGAAPYDYMNMIYCLESSKQFPQGSGNTGDTDQSFDGTWNTNMTIGQKVWYKLSEDQREAIALIIAYGCPNGLWDASWGLNADGNWNKNNPNIGYRTATQVLIWEIIGYNRQATYPYDGSVSSWYSTCVGQCMSADGTVDHFVAGYNYIINCLKNHSDTTIPSFTSSAAASAPEHDLSGKTSLTLTDTNGVLSKYSFTNTSGVSYSKSGNNLTISVSGTVPTGVQTATKSVPNPRDSLYELWYSSWTYDLQTCIRVSAPSYNSVQAYYKLKSAPTTKPFTLTKSIDASAECIAQIQGNPMYSLAGAQYQVSVNGTVMETLTTNVNGQATSAKEYKIGSVVTVKEIKAPPGFKLNPGTYSFTITDGTNSFSVSDEPVFDPPFAITKVDKTTTNPQGNTSFSGAIFKWEYFTNTSWSGVAERTWYFKTDINGESRYLASYLASGYTSDAMYVGTTGQYQIPLGSVKITEIVNSLGYIALPTPLYCTIVADATSSTSVKITWTSDSLQHIVNMASGNFGIYEPIDTTLFGSLTIDKVDAITGTTAQGGGTLANAKFQVINNSTNSVKIGDFPEAAPGTVCYEFYTDANGHFESGAIFPLGSYTVKETTAPTGYTLNSTWSQSFTVTSSQKDFAFTASNGNPCPNTPIMGGIRITKQDSVLGANTGSDALLSGITFSVISENNQPVVVNGVTYQKGDTVLTLEIQWDGSNWAAQSGNAVLPYGTYTVVENPISSGSNIANPYYQLNTVPQTMNVTSNDTVVSLTFTNVLRPGEIRINKDTNTGANMGDWKFDLYNSSKTYMGTYTTPDNGTLIIPDLVPGIYYLVEQGSTDPYWVCDTEEKTVVVEPGKETSVTFTNTHYGRIVGNKTLATDGPLNDWEFTLTDSQGNTYGPYITDDNGKFTTEYLLPGDYVLKEIIPENSLYYCKSDIEQTITVLPGQDAEANFVNALRPGKIQIEKVNFIGKHLAGAKFLLEWSEDGTNWNPVKPNASDDVIKGGCSTVDENGCMTTDSTGIIVFEGLYPSLQYRVTELEAPEGYILLADYAFEGDLPIEELTVELTVYNSQGYILPTTGIEDHTFHLISIGTIIMLVSLATATILMVSNTRKPSHSPIYIKKKGKK